jgi:hypothetical protein
MRSHIHRFGLLLAGLAVLLLAGCNALQGPQTSLEFTAIPADKFQPQQVVRLDTDNDGFQEWVVFYRYDQGGRSPVAGAVYDTDRGEPPIIYPYLLHPIQRDYLSEDGVSAEMLNVIREPDLPRPRLELVIWGTTAGLPTELSIFRQLERYYTNDMPGYRPWEPPTDTPRRYELVGFFRGNAGVSLEVTADPPRVVVKNRDVFERSQLAVRRTYTAHGDTFLRSASPEKLELFGPVETTIDFFAGIPDNVAESPYQEKIVLAYYRAWTNRDLAYGLLSSSAQSRYGKDLVAGCGRPANELRAIQIDALAYVPLRENAAQFSAEGVDATQPEELPQTAQVTISLNCQPKDLPDERALVCWNLVPEAGRWKMDGFWPGTCN